MPGIAGILTIDRGKSREGEVRTMLAQMMHEPFYVSRLHVDVSSGFFAGHVCHRDSYADSPTEGPVKLLMAGECFPRPEVRAGLHAAGSDSGEIAAGLAAEGPALIERLDGWYSGIALDTRTGAAALFNDPCSMQRVYYYEDGRAFYFASEAKALLAVMPETRRIDTRGMGEYYALGGVLENRTIFDGIHLLPPGSIWTFAGRARQRASHVDRARLESQPLMSPGELNEELSAVLRRVAPRYVPESGAAMALTGGVDSRFIVAASGADRWRLPCFTFGSRYRDSIDTRISRRLAKALGQPHRVLRVDDGFFKDFIRHAERTVYLTDGVADAGKTDEMYLNGLVRQFAPVKITGKYGNEVIRGESTLKPGAFDERVLSPEFAGHARAANELVERIKLARPLSAVLFQEIPWTYAGFTQCELSQLMVRSPILDREIIGLLYRAPAGALDSFEADFVRRYAPSLARVPTNRGLGCGLLTRALLRGLDIADKALCHDRLPLGADDWLARMDRWLPTFGPARLLAGYSTFRHYGRWFRKEVASQVADVLLSRETLERPYWNGPALRRAVEDHVSGRANHVGVLRRALSVELVHRTLVSAKPARIDAMKRVEAR